MRAPTRTPRGLRWIAPALACAGLSLGSACAKALHPEAKARTEAPPAATPAPVTPAAALSPALTYTLRPQLDPPSDGSSSPQPQTQPQRDAWTVDVEASGPGEALREWSLLDDATLELIDVADAEGPIQTSETVDAPRVRVLLSRAPSSPLRLRYRLSAPSPEPPGETTRAVRDLVLRRQHLVADADALLLRPDQLADTALPITIHVDEEAIAATPSEDPQAPPQLLLASTLGLPELAGLAKHTAQEGTQRLTIRPSELSRGALIAGPLESVRFDVFGGHDRFAFIGPAIFDVRWAAAEIAGMRSAIDLYFGYLSEAPYTTLFSLRPRASWEPPFTAQLRSRGLIIHGHSRVAWGAAARMTIAQTLVTRWLGGRVRLLDEASVEPGAELLWLSGGVSRFIAWELLFGLGALSDEEFTAEINAWEATVVTSPHRLRSRLELAAMIDAGGVEAEAAQALLVSRGALYAADLNSQLRGDGQATSSLGALVNLVVSTALSQEVRDLPLSLWIDSASEVLGKPADPGFRAAIDRGDRPRLAKGSLGPCFRPHTSTYRRFVLGFRDRSPASGRPSIDELDPRGPAARAGLRESDSITLLRYAAGDPEVPVKITIEREGTPISFEYLPAGPKMRGVGWRRVPGVPDELCVR